MCNAWEPSHRGCLFQGLLQPHLVPALPANMLHLPAPPSHRQATPGGDIAELAAAIATYYNMTGVSAVTPASLRDILAALMHDVITPERPFYYQ